MQCNFVIELQMEIGHCRLVTVEQSGSGHDHYSGSDCLDSHHKQSLSSILLCHKLDPLVLVEVLTPLLV